MKTEYLLDTNRTALKKIFAAHTNPERTLSLNELLKFSQNVHLVPELLSGFEFKRLVMSSTLSNTQPEKKVQLNQFQFEKLLLAVANNCFSHGTSTDKLKLLLIHIKDYCKTLYQVKIKTIPALHSQELREDSLVEIKTKKAKLRSPKQNFSNSSSKTLKSSVSHRSFGHNSKTLNYKMRQLTQILGPKNGSFKANLREKFKPKLKTPSPASPSQNLPTVKNSTTNLKQITELFQKFSKNNQKISKVRGIGSLARKHIYKLQKRKVSNRFALNLSFQYWKLVTKVQSLI